MTRSVIRRVLRDAARAWHGGRPHQAWQILAENGLQGDWPTFQRAALADSRRRYVSAMTDYTR